MNILDKIVAHKKIEVATRKQYTSIKDLEARPAFSIPAISLSASLLKKDSTGIIAEFKRKSPSKGFIKEQADVKEITTAYTQHGAACLSVLTDENFFGGSDADLIQARANDIPILRKDFIIDEYQILEAKAIGADVILLIAACLSPKEVEDLAKFANALGLQTILELHAEEELEHICEATNIVGINNRDLKTFSVDIERSLRMAAALPSDKIKIAESGIDKIEDIVLFRHNGFKGFLIGEHFMKQADTPAAFAEFVNALKTS
ncbi:MAG TPA: indole-3-glycerol phosphate synthase TrpC [Niabella sp.]|nr:indole-3-glycerol phosphate synthase TrpC [Niabella sp.]HOZ97610.1 indole-3-glycerol phosphate synthase TrpC [Niabella sp.]HQW15748.1 indole-3-glycerol phosphate synthase TrpC [Niabella sp.]HQX21023.1 indole-3-glycerol phosphate synthase TrpC [Niabella sp.]HQX41880.1 indole-3-glycerol phosphate synthase TrpC [Niabella sp.]